MVCNTAVREKTWKQTFSFPKQPSKSRLPRGQSWGSHLEMYVQHGVTLHRWLGPLSTWLSEHRQYKFWSLLLSHSCFPVIHPAVFNLSPFTFIPMVTESLCSQRFSSLKNVTNMRQLNYQSQLQYWKIRSLLGKTKRFQIDLLHWHQLQSKQCFNYWQRQSCRSTVHGDLK